MHDLLPTVFPVHGTASGPALCCFRLILAAALLWKITADHVYGMARFFDLHPKSLVRWRYEQDDMAVKVLLSPTAFKVFYAARAVAVLCLLAGCSRRSPRESWPPGACSSSPSTASSTPSSWA
ncbi:hypothetical protein HEP87_59265 [Streptomyces sp. S1D4-11]